MADKLTAWDFVEKYYPNYSSSNTIAENEDLCKLVNKEQQKGDDAHRMLIEDYGGDIKNPQILIDYNQSLVKIYKAAMEAFLETQTDNYKIEIEIGKHTSNDDNEYQQIIKELKQALKDSPNKIVDFACPTITMWEPLENSLTVKQFCDLVGIEL